MPPGEDTVITFSSFGNAQVQQPYRPKTPTNPFSSCPPIPTFGDIFTHPPIRLRQKVLQLPKPSKLPSWTLGEGGRLWCVIFGATLCHPLDEEGDLK